jgi:hypothetical protein
MHNQSGNFNSLSQQFQQAMAQAANQLQKIQKKAQMQNKVALNLGLSGSERPLHQPTKAQLTMPAALQQRQFQNKSVVGRPGMLQPPFPVRQNHFKRLITLHNGILVHHAGSTAEAGIAARGIHRSRRA